MARRISVIIATYNRCALLNELLGDLAQQDLPLEELEVVVVDDGSASPVKPRLDGKSYPFELTVIAQKNCGPAAARHVGVGAATGDILLFVDDDMRVGRDFVRQHAAAHQRGATVVQGYIAPPPELASMPLFERFHAQQLERFVRDVQRGRARFRGIYLCTGNVSVQRAAYLAVGGFDMSLARSEDRELGLRLEKAGAKLAFSLAAKSQHRSDHENLEVWLGRALNYGVFDSRIAKKHPDAAIADPWRFWFQVSVLSRPFLLLAAALPQPAKHLARAAISAAEIADRAGFERAALAGTTLCYGVEYFRGVRLDAGSFAETCAGLWRYVRRELSTSPTADGGLWRAFKADYQALIKTRNKYNGDALTLGHLPLDVLRKIGVQMVLAVRLMQAFRDGALPGGAMVMSRLIRHLYDAEIHWEADIAPGLTIIHGNGLVISRAARIASGCILFHNVTLGEGIDPVTRRMGAPTLERNVHVGPGATLLGPIVIGEGTKIMAGALVTTSVPPHSIVRPAEAFVSPRQLSPTPVERGA
jgi:serine acetyltransferase/GT2 family glycosyltransferase